MRAPNFLRRGLERLGHRARRPAAGPAAPGCRAICATPDIAPGRPWSWRGSAACARSRARRARGAAQSSGAVALNSSTSRPRTAAASGWKASAGASTMKKWMPRASRACMHRRRDLLGRFHRDALEREIDLEHARERLRLVDADLRAGKRMLAGLEDEPLVGADRLVARIALDLDKADGARAGCGAAAGVLARTRERSAAHSADWQQSRHTEQQRLSMPPHASNHR